MESAFGAMMRREMIIAFRLQRFSLISSAGKIERTTPKRHFGVLNCKTGSAAYLRND
jgi:hypothetical protein